MSKDSVLVRSNLKLARLTWGRVSRNKISQLRELTKKYGVSVALGDVQLLEHHWFVTHSGLLRLAERRHCVGVQVQQVARFCDPVANRWVFKATVFKWRGSNGFVGYGDASPENVSTNVLGAEMRVAETRAVNRALRKAYGIGLCSVEELGSAPLRPEPSDKGRAHRFAHSNGDGLTNGQPRLRDRLCILIRKYNLDAARVKCYAADFCGTEVLRDASRDLVESFIATLEEQAAKDLQALICKLNSYPIDQGVRS